MGGGGGSTTAFQFTIEMPKSQTLTFFKNKMFQLFWKGLLLQYFQPMLDKNIPFATDF